MAYIIDSLGVVLLVASMVATQVVGKIARTAPYRYDLDSPITKSGPSHVSKGKFTGHGLSLGIFVQFKVEILHSNLTPENFQFKN